MNEDNWVTLEKDGGKVDLKIFSVDDVWTVDSALFAVFKMFKVDFDVVGETLTTSLVVEMIL